MSDQKPITKQELQAIFDRCERATVGPWSEVIFNNNAISIWQSIDNSCIANIGASGTKFDAEFIRCAREDVPRLVAEMKRLREGLQYLLRPYEAGRYLDWKQKQNEKDLTEFDWAHDVIRNILNGDPECTSV